MDKTDLIDSMFNNFLDKTLTGTNDSDQHLTTLFAITIQLKAKKVLELGVRWGDTTEPMLAGVALNGGHITCLDINESAFVCPEELKPHYTFIQSDAIEFLKQEVEKNAYYDLVYVDDWHSGPHVRKELELIDQITDKKSIILLHDLMGTHHHPEYSYPMDVDVWGEEWAGGGPYAAVKELDLDKWEWATFPVNHGLTVLRKK
ncbi:MAG: class I SAM-dependent methyltransferase [Proteobacteria bacterium]|nr:class I SAM-dependent methyltransferase [Pseudomonadota bacterium]